MTNLQHTFNQYHVGVSLIETIILFLRLLVKNIDDYRKNNNVGTLYI